MSSHTVAPGAVADVSEKPISKSDFDHWLNWSSPPSSAAGLEDEAEGPEAGQPSVQAADAVRSCSSWFGALDRRRGQGRGTSTSRRRGQAQFEQTKSQSFPTEKAYQQFLRRARRRRTSCSACVSTCSPTRFARRSPRTLSQISDERRSRTTTSRTRQQFSQPERRDLQIVVTKSRRRHRRRSAALEKWRELQQGREGVSRSDPPPSSRDGKLLGVAKGQQEKALDEAVFAAAEGKRGRAGQDPAGLLRLQGDQGHQGREAEPRAIQGRHPPAADLTDSSSRRSTSSPTDFQGRSGAARPTAQGLRHPRLLERRESPGADGRSAPPAKAGPPVLPPALGTGAAARARRVAGRRPHPAACPAALPAAVAGAGPPALGAGGQPPALGGGAPAAGSRACLRERPPQGVPAAGRRRSNRCRSRGAQQQAPPAGRRAPGGCAARPSDDRARSRQTREALLALDEVTRRLRRDCPWDREQDERSIVPHTVEEAYELADAAHSRRRRQAARRARRRAVPGPLPRAAARGARTRATSRPVARSVTDKLVRRHPHVFGDGRETRSPTFRPRPGPRPRCGRTGTRSSAPSRRSDDPLAGVPETLPALLYARKLQRRAAGGSDRSDPAEALTDLRAGSSETAAAVAAEGADPEAQERTRTDPTSSTSRSASCCSRGRSLRARCRSTRRSRCARSERSGNAAPRARACDEQDRSGAGHARSSTRAATRRSRSRCALESGAHGRAAVPVRRLDRRVRGGRAARRRRSARRARASAGGRRTSTARSPRRSRPRRRRPGRRSTAR